MGEHLEIQAIVAVTQCRHAWWDLWDESQFYVYYCGHSKDFILFSYSRGTKY